MRSQDIQRIRGVLPTKGCSAEYIHVQSIEETLKGLPERLAAFQPTFCIVDPHFKQIIDGLGVIRIIRGILGDVPVVLLTRFIDDPAVRPRLLNIYTPLPGVRILSKNPFPTWEDFCRAAGLPVEGS